MLGVRALAQQRRKPTSRLSTNQKGIIITMQEWVVVPSESRGGAFCVWSLWSCRYESICTVDWSGYLRGPSDTILLCSRLIVARNPVLSLQDLNRGKFGDVVQLAYQVGGALSTCRLPFRSMILDRYPEQDSAKFPFPGDQLPMFVYPKVRA